MFRHIGTGEILIILLIVLVLFGAKRLPEMGKSMGKGLREFKSGLKDMAKEADEEPQQVSAANATAEPAKATAEPAKATAEPAKATAEPVQPSTRRRTRPQNKNK